MNIFSISSGLRTRRMPLPPPPAVAFNMTGYPIFSANLLASVGPGSIPSLPGITCTPAFSMVAFA